MSGAVSFFEIGVADPIKARTFYGSMFGWTFEDGPSGRGAVIEGCGVPAGIHGDDPAASPYVFLGVDDLDVALARVRELGGAADEPGSDDDAATLERFGRFAWCTDDQGSRFGLHQPPPTTDVADLVALLDDWFQAIAANDAERIGAVMADGWTLVSDQGSTTAQRFLALVRSGELTHSAMSRVGEPDVQIYGDCAVVTVRVINTAHFAGQRFDADEWTTDTFVRRAGRWRCVLSHITAVRAADDPP
jgi:predicted enzyme related to lactoylglutathione lyase/ketosteroid isomerase-like protein